MESLLLFCVRSAVPESSHRQASSGGLLCLSENMGPEQKKSPLLSGGDIRELTCAYLVSYSSSELIRVI
jgi:hypothetical protein